VIEVIRAAAELQAVCYIYSQLEPLAELKGDPNILTNLQRCRSQFEQDT